MVRLLLVCAGLLSTIVCVVQCGSLNTPSDLGLFSGNRLGDFISDLKSLIKDNWKGLRKVIESYPDNYKNSTTTHHNVNGTVIQTNRTITKGTKHNHTMFRYEEHSRVVPANVTGN